MNIYDIANESGVSIATVSRMLNNKGYVSEKTRAKIQKVLDKHDYTPNPMARGLVSKSMNTIAVITVDIRVPSHALTAYMIEQDFTSRGYNVIVCNTGGTLENTMKYIKLMADRMVDGLVFVGSIFNKICKDERIIKAIGKLPIVLANGQLDLPNSYSVLVNDGGGIEKMVKYLYEKGYKEIAYVKDLDTDSAKNKTKSFLKAMKALGISNPDKDVFTCNYGIEGGRSVAKKIWEASKKYEAVVFGEDLTAAGGMQWFTEAGLSIPKDIAVSGFNNSEYAMICNMTSVDNKGGLLGKLSVQLLEDLITGKEIMSSMVIQPELVIRSTT